MAFALVMEQKEIRLMELSAATNSLTFLQSCCSLLAALPTHFAALFVQFAPLRFPVQQLTSAYCGDYRSHKVQHSGARNQQAHRAKVHHQRAACTGRLGQAFAN
jgi:hypothetical protein